MYSLMNWLALSPTVVFLPAPLEHRFTLGSLFGSAALSWSQDFLSLMSFDVSSCSPMLAPFLLILCLSVS